MHLTGNHVTHAVYIVRRVTSEAALPKYPSAAAPLPYPTLSFFRAVSANDVHRVCVCVCVYCMFVAFWQSILASIQELQRQLWEHKNKEEQKDENVSTYAITNSSECKCREKNGANNDERW